MKKINAPKATQLPSGSWRCRVRVGNRDESITADTKKEAEKAALALKMGFLEREEKHDALTVLDCIDLYIQKHEVALSPSTIRGYRVNQRSQFKELQDRNVYELKDSDWQKAILKEKCSPKTIKNAWALFSSACKEIAGKSFSVYLPKVVSEEHQFLQPEQIPILCKAVAGEWYEIPVLLGLHGLRKSEILGLKWKHIDTQKGVICVKGSAVIDEHGHMIEKPDNKNKTSRRTVPIIMPQLLEAVKKQKGNPDEPVYTKYPNALLTAIDKVCADNDLPKIGVHGLRHSWCSLAYSLGVSEKAAMQIGGWSDYQTMRKIYTHVANKDLIDATASMRNYFAFNDHENDHEI